MIQITLYNAIIFYTAVLAFIAVVIWLYTELTARRTYRFLEQQFLWKCGICGYTYLDESSDVISQCPRCGSFNAPEDKNVRDPLLVPHKRALAVPESPPSLEAQRNPSRRKRPHQRRRGPRRRR